ncbi:hypothetical protein [Tenacibaculum maritimum]|uniref:hypothetical protein n=1 Tax=Tenacibaculum maritimum TaxID=107401 RepID=UPI001E5068B4|nr:hypothetical protein [Tenacibaculum maritimum]MCD9612139.1 hypothetical protein [Tenacibaculum maritimum]
MNSSLENYIKYFPWESIKEAMGNCNGIDKSIFNLISDKQKVREESYFNLDNHIVLQGGLYEGAFYVAQFLIHILESKNKIEASLLYELLWEIANGASLNEEEISFVNKGKEFTIYYPEEKEQKVKLRIACRVLILNNYNLFVKEVETNFHNSRFEALELLSSLDEYKEEIKELLNQLLINLNEDNIIEAIKEAIEELDEVNPMVMQPLDFTICNKKFFKESFPPHLDI